MKEDAYMPRPNTVQKQVIDDYQKKIMKAKGNERIRLILESMYLDKLTNRLGNAYDDIYRNAENYFLPRDKKERFMTYGIRERLAELSKFTDDVILPAFDEYRKKNPGRSNEWYKDNFTNTKEGAYHQFVLNLKLNIGLALSRSRTAFLGTEGVDMHGKKRGEDSSLISILVNEANVENRKNMPPEKVGILEQAEQALAQGSEANHIKAVSKEVITKNMTEEGLDEWEVVDLETDQSYKDRQKALRKKDPEYNPRELSPDAWIQFYKGLDFSFIKDEALKKSMNELHHDAKTYDKAGQILKEDYEKNEALFQQLNSFEKKLEKADHSYWINSGSYDDVKKGVQNLRKILIKGETPENRDTFLKAYNELIDICDTYERKHPGIRTQKTGNQRKAIVADLKEFVKQQINQLAINSFSTIDNIPIRRSSSFFELKTEQDMERKSIANSKSKTNRRNSTVLYKGQAAEQEKNQKAEPKKDPKTKQQGGPRVL